MSNALAGQLDIPAIMERIAAGEYASQVAASLGVSPQILSYHLRKQEQWQGILESSHEVRLDSTDQQIEEAIQQRDFDLARAREGQLKRREWRAERECPKRWGSQQVTQPSAFSGGVTINIGNVQAPSVVVEGQVIDADK